LWTKNPEAEKQANLHVYLSDPEVRRRSWQSRRESIARDPKPNAGHFALVELERRAVLDTLVTQNIDGLHQAAGNDPSLVVEIHGTMREVTCMSCGARSPMESAIARVEAGEDDPRCLAPTGRGSECGGILKSATISFGQSLVAEDLERAELAARRCDVMLAVGSTLSVYPAAGLVPIAHSSGARVVIVNGGPTEYDTVADIVVRGSIGDVLPEIVRRSGQRDIEGCD
jgi:NAD-dependent deacetylase